MTNWVIQCVEAIAAHNERDMDYGYKLIFFDRFADKNDSYAALHEGIISRLVQYY